MRKKLYAKLLFVTAAVFSLSACQATPEEEIIKQKGNLEEVIQNSQQEAENSETNLKDTLGVPDQDAFELQTNNKNVEILVDSEVYVPEVTKVPVVHLNRIDFVDADIEKLSKLFFADSEIYPERTYRDYSKDELLQEIAKAQKALENEDAENKELFSRKLEPYISELQSLLETAPDTVILEPITEYKFSELDETYGSQSFMAYGDINGNKGHFNIQKGSSYNSCSFMIDKPEGFLCYSKNDIISEDGVEAANMPINCDYSEEEAVQLCQNIVEKLGKDKEYILYSVEPLADGYPSAGITAYLGYRIKFSRTIEGIPETVDMYMFDDELGCLDTFPYDYERMEFTVSNVGIENFIWTSPLELGERAAENISLLSYSDVIDIFKNQILLKYADQEEVLKVHIPQIRFGYMRVRDNESQSSFTMVPAWDFLCNDYGLMSILTINAIDGSILNRSLGY
ncbi:MAG: hypothetical protein K0S76_1551 [Herbinix sp.]|jgi:hypothetical protein|nr:hypothetical protein [Herbinix sp.]